MHELFHNLLPPYVRCVVAAPSMAFAPLLGDEATAIERAVAGRAQEFRSGRAAARLALAAFGLPPTTIPVGPRRSPIWPPGFVGSITHCTGLCVAAVARSTDLCALGIDAEPALPLPPEVVEHVLTAAEQRVIDDEVTGRVVFCVKEAFYKCWSSAGGPSLDFTDVDVVLDDDRFHVRTPGDGGVVGRWAVCPPFILAAAWRPRQPATDIPAAGRS